MRGSVAKKLRKVALLIFLKDVKPELDAGAPADRLPSLRQIYKRLKRTYIRGH